MDRRDFAKIAGIGALTLGASGVTGCARLLEWSSAQHDRAVSREFASDPASGSAPATGSTPATGAAEATGTVPVAYPDLAVVRGDDPAANTKAAIALLGGMGRFVQRGDRVVVKPNILTAREPRYGVTTNPQAVAAVVRLAFEAGAASVTVFDNSTAPPRQAYDVSGIAAVVEGAGGRMKALSGRDFERIEIPNGRVLTDWPLVTDVFDADVFINMPCAKTHGLAGLTMSMKNLMGTMGGTRGLIHQQFDQKIVDMASFVKPQLVVLDAYRLLIRNGPTGGSLADVRMGRTCVAGTNMVSVDAYGSTLFGRGPDSLAYVSLAAEQGLGVADLSRLTIVEKAV